MENQFRVFVVEDDPVVQNILGATLEEASAVTVFDSAEACQQVLGDSRPNLFLLDIGLPGMDGYTFCRWLKDESDFKATPVMFVSAQDTIEARLAGYTAGAEDFIVKPFDPEELLDKVKVAQRISQEKGSLREQIQAAEQMTDLVLTSMEESGVVLQFLSKVVGASSDQEVAEGLLHLIKSYRLKGAIQTRIGERSYTLSQEGVNLPLEVSVVNHLRNMDRIFEFKTRSVFNFDKVTILVNNMPLENPDFCGRIRDNLAIAAQGADGKLNALEVAEINHRNQQGVLDALDAVRSTLSHLGEMRLNDKKASSEIIYELQEELARSFVTLGLTTGQENHVEDLIKRYLGRFADLFDRGDEQQAMLEDLNRQLAKLSEGTSSS
ncbi:MAG: response regulator [Proteobacteria bacterium]|nr:response regulator [Pseudomonadota bacterium]